MNHFNFTLVRISVSEMVDGCVVSIIGFSSVIIIFKFYLVAWLGGKQNIDKCNTDVKSEYTCNLNTHYMYLLCVALYYCRVVAALISSGDSESCFDDICDPTCNSLSVLHLANSFSLLFSSLLFSSLLFSSIARTWRQ